MKTLKSAVIGLGRIGWRFHAAEIANNEKYRLAAVADASAERRGEAARKYGAATYDDYRRMLDSEELDVAVVATPTVFHMEHALYAIEKGVNVIIEKPMAQTLEEADKIIEAAKKRGVKVTVYQPQRLDIATQAVKKLIDDNTIGPVYMIKMTRSGYSRRNDWQSLLKNGGGMLNNYGAHCIDAALYLTGSRAKKISCSLRKIASAGDADDVVKLTFETENDIICDIDINMASAVRLEPMLIFGKYGSARLEYDEEDPYLEIKRLKEEELPEISVNEELAAPGRTYDNKDKLIWHEEKIEIGDYYTKINFYDKCYDYFALGKEPFTPLDDTREVMRIISECRKQSSFKM